MPTYLGKRSSLEKQFWEQRLGQEEEICLVLLSTILLSCSSWRVTWPTLLIPTQLKAYMYYNALPHEYLGAKYAKEF